MERRGSGVTAEAEQQCVCGGGGEGDVGKFVPDQGRWEGWGHRE